MALFPTMFLIKIFKGLSEITSIDAKIDQLVYVLYGLIEEEIRIVEGGEG